MKYYSQKSYPNVLLGECKKTTLAQAGCFVVSLSMLAEIPPPEVNSILKKNNCFASNKYGVKCMMLSSCAAQALGLEYNGKDWARPEHTCIGETSHWAHAGVPQHFFIFLADGKVIDPLDKSPKPKKNPYHLKSYRLFKPKKLEPKSMPQDLSGGEWQKMVYAFLGHEMPIAEAERIAKTKKAGDGVTELIRMKEHTKWVEKIGNMQEFYEKKNDFEDAEEKIKMLKETKARAGKIADSANYLVALLNNI